VLGCLRRASKPIAPVDTPYPDFDGLPEPWNTFDAMWLLAEQLDDPDAREFVSKFKRTDFFSSKNRTVQLAGFLPLVEAAAVKRGFLTASERPRGN
jgi:hypothetical protein